MPALPSARAQAPSPSTNYALTVRTERADAIYRKGDPVVFEVRLMHGQKPVDEAEVKWAISKDGVPPITEGALGLAHGYGAVTGRLDEPGFLQCRATWDTPAGRTLAAVGGAAVSPLEIRPSLPVPDDFDAFWAGQKRQLAAVPIRPRLTPVPSPRPGIDCWDLQADCVGAPVSGYLSRPVDARPRSLPIMLTVHGAGVRSASLAGAAGWAEQGFLALDINAHGIPNGKPVEYYADLAKSALADYRWRGRESRETVYFRGMFLRLVRALDCLTAQSEWDGRTVVVHGSSQGGAQSIVAAGLDPRVTFFAAGVPAMCDHSGGAAGRVSGWPKMVPAGPDGRPDAAILEAARYYDAMNFATRTRAAGILTVGFIDTTCPPTSVYAAYNALGGPREIFNDPPSTHAVSSKAAQAMRDAILRHVQSRRGAGPSANLDRGAGSAGRYAETDAFVSGQGGYHTYRIPSLLATPAGTLLAFAEGRKSGRGDAGNIDLLLRRSLDQGRTWEPVQTIWDDGSNTCGNPCPVFDRQTGAIELLMTWNRGEDTEPRIIDQTSRDSRRVWATRSADDGRTWAPPREITADVKRPDWTWYATGPGAGIQIERGPLAGRLVIPCDHIEAGTRGHYSHVIYSDDHGRAWRLGGRTPLPQVNECEVVELADGRLRLNMRNYDRLQRTRQTALSDDGGLTWSGQVHAPDLIEPVCQATIRRYSWPAADRPGIILFANPASEKRERMTVRASQDDGQTWPVARRVTDKPSAYSCLAALPDKTIGLLFETGEKSPYERIVFARFDLAWLGL